MDMDTILDSRVTVRLFVGCSVSPEMRVNLQHSMGWKQAAILRSTEKDVLIETHYQNKSYIGLYADDRFLTLHEVRRLQHIVREQINEYCPKLVGIDKLPIYVFPQIFVA